MQRMGSVSINEAHAETYLMVRMGSSASRVYNVATSNAEAVRQINTTKNASRMALLCGSQRSLALAGP